jgi:carbon-monoxide dehydrogenase large subunit
VRVIAPDVGGAFGAKSSLGPEELAVGWLARELGASVKWTASRAEEFTSGSHGRGARLHGELALDAAGRFVGLRARLHFPLGAWLPFSGVVPARNAARILPGPYRVAHVDVHARADRANTAPVNIYRGAGRPEAALLMERLVERAARRAGVDPVALRLRNLPAPGAGAADATGADHPLPSGDQLDGIDHAALLRRACDAFGYDAQRRERAARRAGGELVGIGVALYVEPCGQGWESARVTLAADGTVQVASGSPAQGQGHETSFAAIAARALGCDASTITVVHGDTARCPEGIGALASRSIAIGGSAVLLAARGAAARRAAGEPLPIVEECRYDAPAEAWSHGCVIARMAVDRDTGRPTIERIVWVDDAGLVVSPRLAHGQLLGGLAQGVGQAMLERIVYDADGQLLTGGRAVDAVDAHAGQRAGRARRRRGRLHRRAGGAAQRRGGRAGGPGARRRYGPRPRPRPRLPADGRAAVAGPERPHRADPMKYRKHDAKDYAREHFRGVWAATATPFAEDDLSLDEAGFRRNLEHWVGALQLGGLFISGKQGEFFSMSVDERKRTF